MRVRAGNSTPARAGSGLPLMNTSPRFFAAFAFAIASLATSAYATDYVSVADNSAVLYDAPSLKAKKLFVVSRYLPLEQVVSLDNWVKVRDSSGSLAWIEKRALSSKRFLVTTASVTILRQAPEINAAAILQVHQHVALEWLENTTAGWLKVRHQDGVTGYVKTTDVWGD